MPERLTESDTAHPAPPTATGAWTLARIIACFETPFNELLYRAHTTHREHFDPNAVQMSTLLSVKTGGCPEDCGYCAQSNRYDTGVSAEKLMDLDDVLAAAERAKAAGASRFCMGAAWRELRDRDLKAVSAMIEGVKELGLETCVTLGMVTAGQAQRLEAAGLDYYNHNIDTSAEYYPRVVTTRTYQDRLDTLAKLRRAGVKLCCGGIVGMGETRRDRAGMLMTLANLPEPPESVPINMLVPIAGTPRAHSPPLDPFEFVRTVAVARILLPCSVVRLSAGREAMSDELQALCFFAGANSIFIGEKLLTAPNADAQADATLFERLGLTAMVPATSPVRPRRSVL